MTIPPLADTHCHLLAGLDDGPRTPDDAVAMCRKAYDQGVRHSIALAHQNDDYPENSPQRIKSAFAKLTDAVAVPTLTVMTSGPPAMAVKEPPGATL